MATRLMSAKPVGAFIEPQPEQQEQTMSNQLAGLFHAEQPSDADDIAATIIQGLGDSWKHVTLAAFMGGVGELEGRDPGMTRSIRLGDIFRGLKGVAAAGGSGVAPADIVAIQGELPPKGVHEMGGVVDAIHAKTQLGKRAIRKAITALAKAHPEHIQRADPAGTAGPNWGKIKIK